MVTIRQHGSLGELFDLNTFLNEIDAFTKVEVWEISVEECIGDGASKIEALSSPEFVKIEPGKLSQMYRGIHQTIDGEFVGFILGREWCRLVAVDSSYWQISGPQELESQMEKRYGRYQSSIA